MFLNMFQAFDWCLEKNSDELTIICWCFGEKGPTCLRIKGFYYYFFAEPPEGFNDQNKEKYERKLKKLLCCEVRFRDRVLLYYYSEKPRPFMLLCFKNKESMEKAYKLLLKNKWRVYEKEIKPILKFVSNRNLKFSGWFEARNMKKVPETEKISSLDEYYVTVDNIIPVDNPKEMRKPKILSFDIECFSENINIMPEPIYARNQVLMISMIFQEGNRRTRYLITHVPVFEIPDVNLIRVENELELLHKFQDMILQEDPDVIIGYNIFGFDYYYMHTRLGMYLEEWKNIGRICNITPKLKDISWESSAYGEQKIRFLRMNGRISIDLLQVIRRDYKLPQYNLDTVAKEFLGRGKHDVEHSFIFQTFYHHLQGKEVTEEFTKISKYCLEDSNLVLDLFEKLNLWIALTELSCIVHVPIVSLITRGQQIRCFSQIYHLASKRGVIINRRKEEKRDYKGANVIEPTQGLHEHVICLDFKSLYPSIIMSHNICYTTFVLDKNIKDNECHVIEWDDEGQKQRYRFVKKERLEGIIPTIVRRLIDERNNVKRLLSQEKDPLKKIIYDKRQWALKISANSFFGFLGTTDKGMLPLLEASMCITAEGRKTILECKKFLEETHQAKIIYGDTDSVFFNFPDTRSIEEVFKRGKELTTEINQKFHPLEIEFEKAGRMLCLLKKHYAFWVYDEKKKEPKWNISYVSANRTHSEIAVFKMTPDSTELLPLNKIMADKKEVEVYDPLNGEKIKIEKKIVPNILYKGIALARRDNCSWCRKIYETLLHYVMISHRSVYESYDMIRDYIVDLFLDRVPMEDLFVTKGVKVNYKNNSAYKILTERLKKNGVVIHQGTRLDFVVVEGDKKSKVGERMVVREELKNTKVKIDKRYYAENLLKRKIETLFQIGYSHEITPEIQRVFRYLKKKIPELKQIIERAKLEETPETLERLLSVKHKDFGDMIRCLVNEYKQKRLFLIDNPVDNTILVMSLKSQVTEELKSKIPRYPAIDE